MKAEKIIPIKTLYDTKKKPTAVVVSTKVLDKLYAECEDYCDYLTVMKRSGKKEKTYTSEEVNRMFRSKS